jgi:hypothetical protein
LILETERQFQPFGETIPVRDPESNEITEIPYRYPVGEGLDNFKITLTAADAAVARERDFEHKAIRFQQLQGYANFVAQVAGPMSNPMATPAQVGLFQKILEMANTVFLDIATDERTDKETFDLRPQIDALVQERTAAMMAMQQQQAIGGMNEGSPDGGGPMAGPGGPADAGAMPPMVGGPGNAEDPSSGSAPAPPPV